MKREPGGGSSEWVGNYVLFIFFWGGGLCFEMMMMPRISNRMVCHDETSMYYIKGHRVFHSSWFQSHRKDFFTYYKNVGKLISERTRRGLILYHMTINLLRHFSWKAMAMASLWLVGLSLIHI